jgi:hypothetical protein
MSDNFIADTQLIKENHSTIEKLFEERKRYQGSTAAVNLIYLDR